MILEQPGADLGPLQVAEDAQIGLRSSLLTLRIFWMTAILRSWVL